MHYRKFTALVAFALVTFVSTAYADEKLDAVEKQIVAKWDKVKSMTAKMDMAMDIDQGGMKMKSTMTGTVEYLKHNGKMHSRSEGNTEMTFDMGGTPNTMKSSMLMVSDGEIMHTLSEQMGQKMCVKSKADANASTGADMLQSLKKDFELSLGNDEAVEGTKCWVINAKPKAAPQPNAPVKYVYYFSQDDGAMLKFKGFDASDKAMMTMTYSEIKFNEKIDPKRFEFKVPEGVQVMDMTNTP